MIGIPPATSSLAAWIRRAYEVISISKEIDCFWNGVQWEALDWILCQCLRPSEKEIACLPEITQDKMFYAVINHENMLFE